MRGTFWANAVLVLAIVVAALWFISFPPEKAAGQIFINGVAQNPGDAQKGFSVHKDSQAVSESIEDFERYRDKKAWEKAIGAFNKLVDAKPTGLVADKDGFFISSFLKIQTELLSLPADGREAYRLFNDAKADQMLRDAVVRSSDTTGGKASAEADASADAANPDDIPALRQIVERYFITSTGDKAADRLGDALFESGDFDGAAHAWRLILDNYPDTTLSGLMLETKLAIALARGEHWSEFNSVRSKIRDRYAGQTITLGGTDVVAADYLDTLAKDEHPTTEPSADSAAISPSTFVAPADSQIVMPTSDTPIWQIPLMDDDTTKQLQNAFQQFGWMMMVGRISSCIPATAVDDKRLYVNWFGSCFAADLHTGKMLWRTNGLSNFSQNMQQAIMQGQGANFDGFSVAAAGDRVLFVRKDINGQSEPNRLICLDSASGKNIWTSANGSLSDQYFVGQPLIVGDNIYICAHTTSNQETSLLCIDLAKGALRWSLVLGTPVLGTDFRGQPEEKIPDLFAHQGKIYMQTNNGAIFEINPNSKSIDWAFTFSTLAEQGQQMFFYNQSTPPDMKSPGSFLVRKSTLYLKERGGDTIYAIDLAGPTLLWKRPLDATVALVACDEDRLWVAGSDVDCIDLHSREMQWSDKLSTAVGNIRPLLGAGHLYVFGQRGIHDITTGNGDTAPLFRGYDRDCFGGILWQTHDRLISVSNTAITAYPLGGGEQP